MREVTLYEITQRQVLCTGDVLELMGHYVDNISTIEDCEYIVDLTYEKIQLPIRTYRRSDQEPRYIALSKEVKEVLDVEIESTDTNRYLRGKIDLLKEENDYLKKTLKKCQDMSVMGHVKIIFNKIFKGV